MDIEDQLGDIEKDIFRAIRSFNYFEEYHPPGATDAYQELIQFSKLLGKTTKADINLYLFSLHSLHRFLTRYNEEKCTQYGFLYNADDVRTEIETNFIEWTGRTKKMIKKWISRAKRAYYMFGSSATWLKGLDQNSRITVRTVYRAKKKVRSQITQWVKEAFISYPPPSPSSSLSPPPLSDSTWSPSTTLSDFEELSPIPSLPSLPSTPTPDLTDMELVQEVPPAIIEICQASLYPIGCVPQQQQYSLTYLGHPGALLDSFVNHPEADRIVNAPSTHCINERFFRSTSRILVINCEPFVYNINILDILYPNGCSNSSSVCWTENGNSCPFAHLSS